MNDPSAAHRQKFRPYFTSDELLYLISRCKSDPSPKLPLITYLETFAIKIERGVLSPSITTAATIAEELGFLSPPAPKNTIEQLLTVWKTNPSSLSPAELYRVCDHRYINDLMSPAEEKDWEDMQTPEGIKHGN